MTPDQKALLKVLIDNSQALYAGLTRGAIPLQMVLDAEQGIIEFAEQLEAEARREQADAAPSMLQDLREQRRAILRAYAEEYIQNPSADEDETPPDIEGYLNQLESLDTQQADVPSMLQDLLQSLEALVTRFGGTLTQTGTLAKFNEEGSDG